MGQTIYKYGGYEGNYTPVTLTKPGLYKVTYSYEHYTIPDQFTLRFNGNVLLDTHFVPGHNTGTFKIRVPDSGGKLAAVVATNNPSTAWWFTLEIDDGPSKPVAVADKYRVGKNDHVAGVSGIAKVLNLAANDTDDDGDLDPASIVITSAPRHGTVSANADGTVIYRLNGSTPGTDSFFYTISDRAGHVSDPVKVTILGDCPDTAPLTVSGTLRHLTSADVCVGQDYHDIGLDGGLSDLLRVDTYPSGAASRGQVLVFADRIEIRNARILPVQALGGPGDALFYGNLTLPTGGAAPVSSSALSVTASSDEFRYHMAGLWFKPTQLQLTTEQLNVAGGFALPEALGGGDIDLPLVNGLVFKPSGVSLGGGTVQIPNGDFTFFHRVKASWEDVTIGYQSVQNTLNFNGKVTLQGGIVQKDDGTSTGPSGSKVTLDFSSSGGGFLRIKDGVPEFNGSFAIGSMVAKGGWGLDELKLIAHTEGGQWLEAGFGLKFIFPFTRSANPNGAHVGLNATAVAAFNPNWTPGSDESGVGLKELTIGVTNLDIPIPQAPGIFFEDAEGSVKNLAPWLTDDISFGGKLKFTLGDSSMKVQADLTPWLGSNSGVDPVLDGNFLNLTLDGNASVGRNDGHFKLHGGAELTVIGDLFLKLSGGVDADLDAGSIQLSGALTGLAGLLSGQASGRLALGSAVSLALSGTTAIAFPNLQSWGPLAGKQLADANLRFMYSNDGDATNDVFAAWEHLNVPIPYLGDVVLTAGVKFTFGSSGVPTPGLILRAADVPVVGSWDTVDNQQWLMMQSRWTNQVSDQLHLKVLFTDAVTHQQTIYDQADFDANGITVVEPLSGDYAATVMVALPAVGRWDLLLPTADYDFGTIEIQGWREAADPHIHEAGMWMSDSDNGIDYYGTDLAPDSTVSFYLDSDGYGFDGMLLGSGLAIDGSVRSFQFTADPLAGDDDDWVYLYAVIDSPNGVPQMEYIGGPIQTLQPTDLHLERFIQDKVAEGEYFSYTLVVTNLSARTAKDVVLSEFVDGGEILGVSVQGGDWQRIDSGHISITPWSDLYQGDELRVDIFAHASRWISHDQYDYDPDTDQYPDYEEQDFRAEANVSSSTFEWNKADNTNIYIGRFIDATPRPEDSNGDLKVERIFTSDVSGPIGFVTYDLVVTNQGPGRVTGATLSEKVSGGALDGYYAQPLGDYQYIRTDGQQFKVTLPDLDPGQKYVLPMRLWAAEAANLTLQAEVAQQGVDIDHHNDFAIDHLDATILGNKPGDVDIALRVGSVTEGADGLVLLRLDLVSEGIFTNLASDIQVKISTGSGLSVVSADAQPAIGQPVDISFPTYDPGSGVWALNGAIQGDGQIRSLNITLHKDDPAGGVFRAELVGLREHDVDSTPGNGDPTEDDMVVTTIGSVNHAPVLASPLPDYTINEGQPFSIQLPANTFVDPDGDQVQYTIRGTGSGTPGYDGGYNNTYYYQPVPSWVHFDSATRTLSGVAASSQTDQAYTIEVVAYDNRGGIATDRFRLAVNDVRTAPEPNKAYPEITAFVGVPLTYQLPSNVAWDANRAYWIDGDLYRKIPGTYDYNHTSFEFFQNTGAPSWLGVYGGMITGTPDAPGVYDLTVVGRNHYYDGQDLDGTQHVRLTVVAIEPPVVTTRLATQYGTENVPFHLDVPTDAFSDPNGDVLGYWWTGLPDWLSYDVETGALSGTPIQGNEGAFDAVLHASDGKLGVAEQTVHFVIVNVNDRPAPIEDWYALLPGTALTGNVGLNDVDKDNDPLSFALADGVQHGTLVFNPDGSFTYTPEAGYQGADFFTYTASDGQLISAPTRVSLFVQPPPVGTPDAYSARMNIHPDSWSGTWGNRVLVVDADHGVLANDDLGPNAVWRQAEVADAPAHGVLVLAHDGGFTYRADDDFFGTDRFSYRPWDGLAYGDPVEVTITVPFENRPAAGWSDYLPGDGVTWIISGQPYTFSADRLLANDDARDGDPLHVVITRGPKNGTLVDNGDGTFTYTADDGFRGGDYFYYSPYDPYGPGLSVVQVGLSVALPVDAFYEVRDDYYATPRDTTLVASAATGVARNDVDPDDGVFWAGDGYNYTPLRIGETLVSGPQHGRLNYFNGDGSFSYTPDAGFTGVDTFVYRSVEQYRADGDGDQNPGRATVSIYVGQSLPDPAPTGTADSYTVAEDTILKVGVAQGVLANDSSGTGGPLVAELVQQAAHGRVFLSPYGNFRYEPTLDWYGKPLNWNGQDAFTYRVWDGAKASAPIAVVINVTPVPDLPQPQDVYASVYLDWSYNPQGNLASQMNRPDGDGALTAVNGDPAKVGTFVQGTYGKLFLGADGSYLWQPDRALPALIALKPGELAEDLYTFTWTNAAGSATASFHGQIFGVDDPTTLVPDHYSTHTNTPLNVYAFDGVLANDLDPDSTPAGAHVVSTTANGTLAFNPSGAFVYTPNLGFVGTDRFSYTATSANNAPAVEVLIDVQPWAVNTPPVAVADHYAMAGAGPLVVGAAQGVLANDSDAQNDPIIALLEQGPQHGRLNLNQDGSFRYQADPGFSGTDGFSYRASDGQAASAVTQVSITVPVNQVPVADDGPFTTAEDTPLAGSLAALAHDPDGDALTYDLVLQAMHGAVRVSADGSFTYTPERDWFGSDSFTYRAFDGRDADTGVVSITVTPVNDAPIAAPIGYQMQQNGVLVVQPPGALAYVFDADGDPLTFLAITQPTVGTFVYSADGGFTYTPPTNFTGTQNFQYAANDGQVQSNTAVVTITVLSQNHPPATQEDFFTTAFNTPIAASVLANDFDSDGDVLSAVVRTAPQHGTAVAQADGTILYTPNAGFRGSDTFEYSAFDGVNLSVRTPVTITVEPPPNIAPIANPDSAVTNEDTPVVIDVLANDIPGDDDPLTITIVEGSPLGSATVTPDQKIAFYPYPDANGYTSFVYRIDDGRDFSEATVTVSIVPVPDAPLAYYSYFTIRHATATVIDPLARAYDPDGDPLTFQLIAPPQHGTLVQQPDGRFLYTPDPGYGGPDAALYRLADGTGLYSPVVRIDLSVAARNNAPPDARDGAYLVLENTERGGNLHALASDADRDPLTFSVAAGPAHGQLVLDGATGIWTYTPGHGYVGSDQFEYGASDGDVLARAVVRFTITADNHPPVVVGEQVETPRDQPIEVDVLANDSDPEGGALGLLIAAAPNGGNAVVTANNTILFTPAPGFTGDAVITYQVSDPQGASASGTLLIHVIVPPNHAPVAIDQAPTIAEDTQLSGNLLDFGSDPDGDALVARITDLPSHGLLQFERDDGHFTYTPAPDYNGTDSFSFALTDPHGAEGIATVSITITAVPDPPVARPDQVETPEDVPVSGNVLANDTDADGDVLTAYLAPGTQTVTPLGTLTFAADGAWQFVPEPDANGTAVFTYFATDGVFATPATLTIVVAAVNDPPVAAADSATTLEDTAVSGNVLANDSDIDSPVLTAALAAGVDPVSALGTLVLAANGEWTFTPAPDASGTVVYRYVASDGEFGAIATLTITVLPVNDPPVAVADTATTLEDVAVSGNVLANDLDIDSPVLAAALAAGVDPASALGTLVLAANGDWTFTPAPDASGTVVYDYVVSDGELTATSTLTITVLPVNDPPVAAADSYSLAYGATLAVPSATGVLANDFDVDSPLLRAVLADTVQHGVLVLDADSGAFTYTPDAGFSGLDQFTYRASDGQAESDLVTVTLQVAGPGAHPPVAQDDAATVAAGGVLHASVADNDSDPDGDGLSFALLSGPQHGSVVLDMDGSYIYTPAPSFSGTDSFTYRASDGTLTADATVNIVVTPPANAAPVAVADSATTLEDTAVSGNVLANDLDSDSPVLAAALAAGVDPVSALGTLVLAANGDWTFTPAPDASGTVVYDYVVSDGELTATSTLTITVLPVNDPPVAGDDTAATAYNTPVLIPLTALLANDRDPDGDPLAILAVMHGSGGAAQIIGDNVVFTPTAGFSGQAHFSYLLSDGLLTDTADVMVTVGDPPPPGAGTPAFRFGDGASGIPLGSTPQPPLSLPATVNQLVHYTPNADGGTDVLMSGAWNAIKWLDLSFTGGAAEGTWSVRNMVALYADFGGDAAATADGLNFTAVGLKRGMVSFGDGNDTITWVAHSNGGEAQGWSELTTIGTGGGNDVVRLFSVNSSILDDQMLGGADNGKLWNSRYDGRYSRFMIDLGDGDDQLIMLPTDRMRVEVKGGAGSDTIRLGAGEDRIDGGAGADILFGGRGNDTFVMRAGEVDGDRILDFEGAGAPGGDVLEFHGYGAGASIEALGGGQYRVAGNGYSEVFTLMNANQAVTNLAAQDWLMLN